MHTHQMLINGQWVNAASGEFFDDCNPYTGEVFARVPKGGVEDAGLAMGASAFGARKPWSSTPPLERPRILFKAARLLEEGMQEYAQLLMTEGGSTFGKAMFEISQTIDLLPTAAGDCKRILGETFQTDPSKLSMTMLSPKGTVVAISPWNFPLILSMYKVAYALGTGNTVVLKPASDTPVIGLKIGELFEKAGLMPGALNVLTGPGSVLGDALIADERCSMVSLTGETVTGRHVAKKAAENLKEYTLEMGGKPTGYSGGLRCGLCGKHGSLRGVFAPRPNLHVGGAYCGGGTDRSRVCREIGGESGHAAQGQSKPTPYRRRPADQ